MDRSLQHAQLQLLKAEDLGSSRPQSPLLPRGMSPKTDIEKLILGHKYVHKRPILIAMVGLPARGKSYISKKTMNYLNWRGMRAEIFNVGNHRRVSSLSREQKADFFSNSDEEAKNMREKLAYEVLSAGLKYLAEGGDVVFFDATNTTHTRRSMVLELCAAHPANPYVFFCESICDDPEVLHANLQQKITNSEDYKHMDQALALADLTQRMHHYESVYETITSDALSYVKLINLQSKVIVNRIYGIVAHTIVSYLMSLHVTSRPIYLTRAGYSQLKTVSTPTTRRVNKGHEQEPVLTTSLSAGNLQMSVPDSKLNLTGDAFAKGLPRFFEEHHTKSELEDILVFTSPVKRCIDTAMYLSVPTHPRSALNCLDLGTCRGMTLEQFQDQLPEEFEKFEADPFNYRLEGAETLGEFIHNLEPLVKEVEQTTCPVLIISHHTTLQILYAYFRGIPISQLTSIRIPNHTIIKLEPNQYGWTESRYDLSKHFVLLEQEFPL